MYLDILCVRVLEHVVVEDNVAQLVWVILCVVHLRQSTNRSNANKKTRTPTEWTPSGQTYLPKDVVVLEELIGLHEIELVLRTGRLRMVVLHQRDDPLPSP